MFSTSSGQVARFPSARTNAISTRAGSLAQARFKNARNPLPVKPRNYSEYLHLVASDRSHHFPEPFSENSDGASLTPMLWIASKQKGVCPWAAVLGGATCSGTSLNAREEKADEGEKPDTSQGDAEEDGPLEECARLRALPRPMSVDAAMAALDKDLEQVELRATDALQKLAMSVEGLRSDPSSAEELKRQEWVEATLRAYEPLRQQKAENERRERKRKDEEQEAVCYVCGVGHHSHNDTIVFCERCCVAVHASCYNAEGVHLVDNWYCDFCQFGISKAKKRLESVVDAAEATATAAAATTAAAAAIASKTDGQRPALAAPAGVQANARTTDDSGRSTRPSKPPMPPPLPQQHQEPQQQQPVKRCKTSDEGLSGGKKPSASVATFSNSSSKPKLHRKKSSCFSSSSAAGSGATLTEKRDKETETMYSKHGKHIFSRVEASAIAAGKWTTSPRPRESGKTEAAAAGNGGGVGLVGGGETRAGASSTACVPNGHLSPGANVTSMDIAGEMVETLYSSTERQTSEGREWAPLPTSSTASPEPSSPYVAVGWEIAGAGAAAAVTGEAKAMVSTMATVAGGGGAGHAGSDNENGNTIAIANGVRQESTLNGFIATDGRNGKYSASSLPPALSLSSGNKGNAETVKSYAGVEMSVIKRDTHHAKKRSWDDFSTQANGHCAQATATAADTAASGGEAAAAIFDGRGDGSATQQSWEKSVVAVESDLSAKAPAREASTVPNSSKANGRSSGKSDKCSSYRNNSVSVSAAAANPSRSGRSLSPSSGARRLVAFDKRRASTSSMKAASKIVTETKNHHGGGAFDVGDDDHDAMALAKHRLLERAAVFSGVPDVAEALAALEKAEAVVGIDLPSQDKGPPDDDAVCVLCPVPRGAFLRADKGNGMVVWCHCLCALSKGLLIEDRVVKTRGHIKGNGGTCSKCRKGPGGGLILCSKDGCNLIFHPTCGKLWGGSSVRGPHLHPSDWTARCRRHAEPTPPGGEHAYVPVTAHMPVKDMYKRSARAIARAAAKAAKAAGLADAACRGQVSSAGDGSGTGTGGSNGSKGDAQISEYRAEARLVLARTTGAYCPPGSCHRCRRRRRWTVGCANSMCDKFYCAFCIAIQRESPFAVLAAARAAFDAQASGTRPLGLLFTCYSCRGICGCTVCEKAARVEKATKASRARVKAPHNLSSTSTSATKPMLTAPDGIPVRVVRKGNVPKLKPAAEDAIKTDSPKAATSGDKDEPAVATAEMATATSQEASTLAAHSLASRASSSPRASPQTVPKTAAKCKQPAVSPEGSLATAEAVGVPRKDKKQHEGEEPPHAPASDSATRVDKPPSPFLVENDDSLFPSTNPQRAGEKGGGACRQASGMAAGVGGEGNSVANVAVASVTATPWGSATNAQPQLCLQSRGAGDSVGDRSPVQMSVEARPSPAARPVARSLSETPLLPGFTASATAAAAAAFAAAAPWSSPPTTSRALSSTVSRPQTYSSGSGATEPTTKNSSVVPAAVANRARVKPQAQASDAKSQKLSKSNVQQANANRTTAHATPTHQGKRARARPNPKANTKTQANPKAQARVKATIQKRANGKTQLLIPKAQVHANDQAQANAQTWAQVHAANVSFQAQANSQAAHSQSQFRVQANAQTHAQAKAQAQAQTNAANLHAQAYAHARVNPQSYAHAQLHAQAHTSHVHVHCPQAGSRVPAFSRHSSAALAAAGAFPRVVEAARKAEALWKKANDAVGAAQLVSRALAEAKRFSDQKNKAAMLSVEAATKLKDKLIIANELMTGYHSLRRSAENEARMAAKEERVAVARLREAEEDAFSLDLAATTPTNSTVGRSNGGVPVAGDGLGSCLDMHRKQSQILQAGGGITAANPPSGTSQGSATSWWLEGERPIQHTSEASGTGTVVSIPATSLTGCAAVDANKRSHARPDSNDPRGGRASPFRSPIGVLTNMKSAQGAAGGTNSIVEARRLEASAATAAARDKEATVVELAKRQKRAEASRVDLVRETQHASDAASKASKAAMHYEHVMLCKKAEEQVNLKFASNAEKEAVQAEWEMHRMVNPESARVPSGFGGSNGMGVANGGSGGDYGFGADDNAPNGFSGINGTSGDAFGCGGAINGGGVCGGSGGVRGHVSGHEGGFTWSQFQRQTQSLDPVERHSPNLNPSSG